VQNVLAENPATGAIVGQWANYNAPFVYKEYAGFADFTFHFTERFDVQIGGRESQIRQTFSYIQTGLYDPVFFGAPSPIVFPQVDAKSSAFTYLVTPKFKVSPDFMIYARLASGYRPGGPNPSPGVPPEFGPDKTKNYELGVKADFLDHTLSIDTSVYYIDWKNIQVFLSNPVTGQGYTVTRAERRVRVLSSQRSQGL